MRCGARRLLRPMLSLLCPPAPTGVQHAARQQPDGRAAGGVGAARLVHGAEAADSERQSLPWRHAAGRLGECGRLAASSAPAHASRCCCSAALPPWCCECTPSRGRQPACPPAEASPRPRLLALALLSLQGNSSDALQLLQNLNISHSGLTGTLPPWGAPDYPGLQQLTTLTLQGNNLTGTVPASWGNLAQLSRVTLLPGNPGLCVHKPPGANFKVCQAEDQLCRPVDSDSAECAATGSSSGSSSSFPVAAVAVPVAVVGALALAAGGFLVWRKRQQQAAVEPSSVSKAGYW